MAYTYSVQRKNTNLTTTSYATIATSATGDGSGSTHVVILNGQIFNEGTTAETVLISFDGDVSVEWKIVLGGTAGAGANLPVLVADAGCHVRAKLESTGDVEVSVQYAEVTPFEAMQLLHNGARLA